MSRIWDITLCRVQYQEYLASGIKLPTFREAHSASPINLDPGRNGRSSRLRGSEGAQWRMIILILRAY